MDELGEFGYFLLNVVMLLILATWHFGINALIVFGIVMAPIGVITLLSLFFEAATGYSPVVYILKRSWVRN